MIDDLIWWWYHFKKFYREKPQITWLPCWLHNQEKVHAEALFLIENQWSVGGSWKTSTSEDGSWANTTCLWSGPPPSKLGGTQRGQDSINVLGVVPATFLEADDVDDVFPLDAEILKRNWFEIWNDFESLIFFPVFFPVFFVDIWSSGLPWSFWPSPQRPLDICRPRIQIRSNRYQRWYSGNSASERP